MADRMFGEGENFLSSAKNCPPSYFYFGCGWIAGLLFSDASYGQGPAIAGLLVKSVAARRRTAETSLERVSIHLVYPSCFLPLVNPSVIW